MGDQQTTLSAKERRGADPGRLVAFTDGVFAIIITLLVLDLRVPDLDSGQPLRDSLAQLWPSFASFVISFLLVGMYWDWHRTALAQVRFIDRNTVWLTLLFLLPTSMIPFAASALCTSVWSRSSGRIRGPASPPKTCPDPSHADLAG